MSQVKVSLTFIIVADVRVPRLQVDVVLPALTFTALQSALGAHPWTHFLHVETESTQHLCINYESNMSDMMVL